jgi:hypothetical protein
MSVKCLSEMASNASGILQPQIIRAIESIVNNGVNKITANMVRDRCLLLNPNRPWPNRIAAICNGMRNSATCGAIIVSDDRDFGDFTISFENGLTSSNPQKRPNSAKKINKVTSKTNNQKMTQVEFIDSLVDVLHVFSPKGRLRIYKDLTRIETQILCKGQLNGQPAMGVTAFGKPNRLLIEKLIIEKYTDSKYIDDDINWDLTSGVKFDLNETRKSVKLIITFLSKLAKSNTHKNFIITFLKELKGNNHSLIRLLSQPKYESKKPGSRLVGKQTQRSNNKKLGFVLEHTIPANFFVEKLLNLIELNTVNIELNLVISKLFSVWLNTDDDILLKNAGLNSKMPLNWSWNDDPLERYWLAGINKKSLKSIL